MRASAPCTAGSYRTFVRGTVSNGDRGYEVEAISKPTKIPCPPVVRREIATNDPEPWLERVRVAYEVAASRQTST